jgi:SPW repeat
VVEWSNARFCDLVNLLLGTILFFSPWLFSLSLGTPRQTAATAGLLIAVLSIAALTAFAVWEEWLNLIAGLWLIASPCLLGYQDSNATKVHVVIGAGVAGLAAFEAWIAHVGDRLPKSRDRTVR